MHRPARLAPPPCARGPRVALLGGGGLTASARLWLTLAVAGCGSSPVRAPAGDDAAAAVVADLKSPFPIDDLGPSLDADLVSCVGGATVSGKVTAPNGLDPLPGAHVYIADGPIAAFPNTVTCDLCTRPPASRAMTTAGFDGRFNLTGIPDGDVDLVIQLGRFRRVVHLHLDPCQELGLSPGMSRLPRRSGEFDPLDHVPRFAVASGDYDQIECVLKRMGIDAIDLYDDRGGNQVPPTVGTLESLLTDPKKLLSYDVLVANCTNNQFDPLITRPAVQQNLTRYLGQGGRLYATDWAYDMIEQVPALAPYLCFEPQRGGQLMCGPDPQPLSNADSNNPYSNKAEITNPGLASWLALFPGVIDKQQQVDVSFSFVVIDQVAADAMTYPTGTWVRGDTNGFGKKPMTVTFSYNMCGRVHYSTFNTEPNGVVPDNTRYPNCKPTFSPQERILEYLVFEISNCIDPSHQ